MKYPHQPVLVHEVVKYLLHSPCGTFVDGTVGTGGHSLAVAKAMDEKGRLICLDRDPDAVNLSRERLAFLGKDITVIKANYSDLDTVLDELHIKALDGVLLDLGMSSQQLDNSGRGFSFTRDEILDMRMDPDDELTAYDLVNILPQQDLERILRDYGEEKRARLIARAIAAARSENPIKTSSQLARIIKSTFPPHADANKHPATRSFQALRIAINKELHNLETFLRKIPQLMAAGGRLVILSYHSLEDRIVKQTMANWEKGCECPPDFPRCVCGKVVLFRRLFKKGIRPGALEIKINPRARSAVLRAAERMLS
ncbi:S-adenosyl-dependent methyltransferase activity on membrane-located substrates [uncultured Desulfobacterium sp.]|uniref:Ribosomal RNA small subunit methyltransferase H n=1 Tax=uncultured Desulfobacterium sp. TaxID=201089 RepID=A0A445MVY0_9BACT|nr:S-adenosyl-dependent methyltransferase activity on membrane-located substrates [uncultured Desulfobacterium sp.]